MFHLLTESTLNHMYQTYKFSHLPTFWYNQDKIHTSHFSKELNLKNMRLQHITCHHLELLYNPDSPHRNHLSRASVMDHILL